MGENKIDQQVGNTNPSDQHQTYGSQQEGRHNREGASAMDQEDQEEETNNPLMKQQNHINPEDQGGQEGEVETYDYEKEEESFDQGQYSNRSQLVEMQNDNMDAMVEGDDKDILGETENSRRNQQYLKGEANRGNTQKR